jgi:cytochrome P450
MTTIAAETRDPGMPEGPPLPPEAQARLWLERPVEFLERCARRHGDLFTLRIGGFGEIVIAARPDAVREVFALPAESYECRHFNESYRYAMGRRALFLQDGAAHRRLKAVLRPLFTAEALAGHEPAAREAAGVAFAAVEDGAALRLRPLAHAITLDCLALLLFGAGSEAGARMAEEFRVHVWRDLRAWKPWTALSRRHPRLRALLSEEIARRRAGAAPGDDLLGRLAAARDETGATLGDDEIQDQVFMFTITAGDAVAVAASWALERVARRPEIQDRLAEEGARAGADGPRPLLEATVLEVLRLHPILPTISGRKLTRPVTIQGHDLPAGVSLAPCAYLANRNPEAFDDPLAFRPERFLDRSWPAHVFFPFGGARRACLGGTLAPMTIRGVLAAAVERLRLAPIDPAPPAVVRHGTLMAPPPEHALRAFRRDKGAFDHV